MAHSLFMTLNKVYWCLIYMPHRLSVTFFKSSTHKVVRTSSPNTRLPERHLKLESTGKRISRPFPKNTTSITCRSPVHHPHQSLWKVPQSLLLLHVSSQPSQMVLTATSYRKPSFLFHRVTTALPLVLTPSLSHTCLKIDLS